MVTKYLKTALLCKPELFEVSYSINPWMKSGSINKNRALRQWSQLYATLTSLGIEIKTIKQQKGLPDMIFAADLGIFKGKSALVSNFRFTQRQGESHVFTKWAIENGYSTVCPNKKLFIEGGGDTIHLQKLVVMGTGFRTSPKSCDFLAKFLAKETVCLNLINPKFYHLDTCLFVLNDETAFYYPPAFDEESVKNIKKIFKSTFVISEREADNFAANSLVTDHHVIIQKGNPEIKDRVESMKYKAIEIDASEFMKAGGGIHCLVGVIEESYA